MRQFSGLDSVFLFVDSEDLPMHGAFLLTYAPVEGVSPRKRFERIVRLVESKLYSSPVLCRKVERFPMNIDHPCWVVDTDIDLTHHVQRVALPEPGDFEQICELYAQIHARHLDMDRPLWEIHVIDGLNAIDWAPAGSFALIIKFHHAGADGITATEITSALHRETPQRHRLSKAGSRAEPTGEDAEPISLRSIPKALNRTTAAYLRLWYQVAKLLPDAGLSLGRKALQIGRPRSRDPEEEPPAEVPRTRFNAPITNTRSYTNLQVTLDDIKYIRNAFGGVTVNDVYLTICSDALFRYLDHHGEAPEESLYAACPVNVRVEDEAGAGGNQFSIMRVKLHSDERDPLKRLGAIAGETRERKESGESSGSFRKLTDIVNNLPGPLVAGLGAVLSATELTATMHPLANMIVTNVPGPRKKLYLDGAEMLEWNGCPPIMDGLGIIIGASSYVDHMTITTWACRKMMPDPGLMRRYLKESLEDLYRAASEL